MKQTHIFFDFDGTIADSKTGIVSSLSYALKHAGVQGVTEERMALQIGNPVEYILATLCETTNKKIIRKGVEDFRLWYRMHGITQFSLYPGMELLFEKLQKAGKTLYIVSNKLTEPLNAIIDNAGILRYFKEVRGIDGSGPVTRKQKDIAFLMKKYDIAADTAIMIGDSIHDIEAGRRNNLFTIGVLYGYGNENDLRAKAANQVVRSVRELSEILLH